MTDWMDRGNCRNYPKDHMFLSDGDLRRPSAAGRARVAEKLAICQECPVQEACREWAVQVVMASQVKWEDCIIGGARPAEINTDAARRYRPACGTRAGHRWHLANNEASCEPCRTASRMYERERVQRRKAAA